MRGLCSSVKWALGQRLARGALGLGFGALLVLFLPSTAAWASNVDVTSGDTITFTAVAGETNDVIVTYDPTIAFFVGPPGAYIITDNGAAGGILTSTGATCPPRA